MWVRKTYFEIQSDREKKTRGFKKPIIYALCIFIGSAIWIKVGYDKYSRPTFRPISWEQFFQSGLLDAFLFGAFCFVIFYFLQRNNLSLFGGEIKTLLCTKCNQTKQDDKNYKCECGGKFVDIIKMKWVDDE